MKTTGFIRPMTPMDCNEVVQVHLDSFKGFFLSILGSQFLHLFYCKLIVDESSIAFVCIKGDHIRGFITGSTQPSDLYSRLLRKNIWQFGWSAFPAFRRNPKILPRLMRAFLKTHEEQPTKKCGELMSIAVPPEYQGQGVGNQLVQAFLEESRQRGLCFVNLTTDAKNNDAVNKFYLKLGFNKYRTYVTPEKRMMNEYIILL